ncbi:asparagine synthase (glutamine-hydrolyzing) [Salibacteraceae bacterium]|nr:asparagine synthase (glutamine-hydrolyzing) [Salibacteraceae bacterium]MDC1304132.1 asparagine synthase (glutamine-hydrolyzing) [Salibacteraceae bacterium]
MCGILGLIDLNRDAGKFKQFEPALSLLHHRGPDHQKAIIQSPIALGHTRLSIIDLDARSNQPMVDLSGRFTLAFNGEIYNYKELRNECEQLGYSFKTESDTEVLLVLFMHFGEKCLVKLNGFFAFGIYDKKEKSLFIARDRFGIKPLVYYQSETRFGFSSELKALMKFGFEKKIDKVSLFTFFKFNYIPAPSTILKNNYKLEPGHSLKITIKEDELEYSKNQWYSIPYDPTAEKDLNPHDYQQSQKVLKRFMRESVRRRLVADVPVGTFLSGGIDSSIITAIAKEEKDDIESFSIGFSDQPFYDESKYAVNVAKHLRVKHHVFDVKSADLIETADYVLNHLDEPFADSSALNVFMLSKHTRPHVKVALSGDGGDELFGGYNKHGAEFMLRYPQLKDHAVGKLKSVWDKLPASRSGYIGNVSRQLQKFADGYSLSARDRYWRWACILNEEQANYFIKEQMLDRDQRLSDDAHTYKKRKDQLLKHIRKNGTLNEVLLSDMLLVLPNDMLYKVDSMSMAHALEVRTPFLDQHLVKHAFKLPVMFKVNHTTKKKILQDSYRDQLPHEVFSRQKKGFEVPLLEWFNGPMKTIFLDFASDRDFIQEQDLFNQDAINDLSTKLFSNKPGDAPASAWAFIVFQSWYKQHML